MGRVQVDTRQGKVKVIFYVGNGKKQIPKLTIMVADTSAESLGAAIEEGFAKLRPALT